MGQVHINTELKSKDNPWVPEKFDKIEHEEISDSLRELSLSVFVLPSFLCTSNFTPTATHNVFN